MHLRLSHLLLLFCTMLVLTLVIGMLWRTRVVAVAPVSASPVATKVLIVRRSVVPAPATPTYVPTGVVRRATPTLPIATPPMLATTAIVSVVVTPTLSPTPLATPIPPPEGFAVVRYPRNSLVHGHGLVIIDTMAYTIDAGRLRAAPLQEGAVRTLTPPNGLIDGVPVKDWIDLAATGDGGLWLLDRMGDLARYDPAANTWQMQRRIVDRYHDPSQLYVALDSFGERAYILDESQGQVWRWPATEVAEGYFGGADIWQRLAAGVDLTRAVDVTVDGAVYVLLREEPEPHKRQPARIRKYQGTAVAWELTLGKTVERPLRIYAFPAAPYLYVIDQDGQRVQALDKATGKLIGSLQLGFEIRALTAHAQRLYLLGRDAIYYSPGSGAVSITASDVSPRAVRPDDPRRWAGLRLASPIKGAFLPDRDSLIPGSPRLYRFGVHEGVDFFGIAIGAPVDIGTAVQAAAAGTVVYADTNYVELSPAQLHSLLQDAAARRNTPPATEARLRGREVAIDHGHGLVTRYAHLSGIAAEIVPGSVVAAGQVIGYAGNSGVEAGVNGTTSGVHLHFEIRLGEQYLGRWLSPLETRRLLNQLFGFDGT